MITPQQEPKYAVDEKGIYNRQSGEHIPLDEPVFILRARDIHAIKTLGFYSAQVADAHHREVIEKRIDQFESFAFLMTERMK